MAQEQQTLVESKQVDCLALFEPIQAQMVIAKKQNLKLTFDYEDSAGNTAARSHIQSLRHVKTEIATVHKVAKAEALAIGRKIDAFKNKLTGEVDEMITVHNEPIQRIQRAREEAVAVELKKIQEAKEKEEVEQLAELERLRAVVKATEEKAAREEAERLAEENTRKAEAERIEREKEIAGMATANAEARMLAEVEEKAEMAHQVGVIKAAAEKKRQENKKHQKKVHDAIEARLTELGLQMHDAIQVLDALKDGTIPHVRIEY